MAQIFGFTIGRKAEEKEQERLPSFVSPQPEDGAIEIAPGGAYGTYVDLEGRARNEAELVNRYRTMSSQPECDEAVQDIVNESIIIDKGRPPIEIVLDDTGQPDSIKTKIRDEFEGILRTLNFNDEAYEIFRKWYVDGRLFFHIVVDEKNPRAGIQDLRYIDPRRIRKVREPIKRRDPTGVVIYKGTHEYYLYNQAGLIGQNAGKGAKIARDSICYVHSGVLDGRKSIVYSHLHKSIKPLNQLRMLEDAVVIYRLARAPERRIFYIDVGNLPKAKAEQYLRDMMVKHKNKLVYDASTGEVRDDRKFMTMLEDFWLPRREGGRGTEITTLPGGQNLGEMEDVEYFKKKLYKSLNVPISRMDSESQFNLGRTSEITRDEIKFSKFIGRLRHRFSILFDQLLEIQLSLKGIMTRAEWKEIRKDVRYDFAEDNHFSELKQMEILQGRVQVLTEIDAYVGKYFSTNWIRKNVLFQTEDDIKQLDAEMAKEGPIEPVDPSMVKEPPDKAESYLVDPELDSMFEELILDLREAAQSFQTINSDNDEGEQNHD